MTTGMNEPFKQTEPRLLPVAGKKQVAGAREAGNSGAARLTYDVVHSLPGRLRLRVYDMRRDAQLVSACLLQLGSHEGIVAVTTNFWCASAIVKYDPQALAEDDVLALVNRLEWPMDAPSGEVSAPSLLVRAIRKILLVLDKTLPAAIQVALGTAAFVCASLRMPTVLTNCLLTVSVAPIASRALHTLVDERKFGVDALDGTAAALMIANGRPIEAGFMTALIGLGEYIRERTARRCEKLVNDLLGLSGQSAWLVKGKKRICVPADEVKVGDIVAVYPGDMVPVDGIVISGEAAIDQSKLTGESMPVEVKKGDNVIWPRPWPLKVRFTFTALLSDRKPEPDWCLTR